ncbi:MAG: ComF family protein [Lachnospiraceae bacterium]|nr:ComF family protein [Lachnospiraceae bacterium]
MNKEKRKCKKLFKKHTKKPQKIGIQLLFPLRCPVCDRIVRPFGKKICPECRGRLRRAQAPWCMKCGKQLQQEEEFCADCRTMQHEYLRGRALYEYESVAPAIYRFKYAGRQEYADFFGEEVARSLYDFIERTQAEALVPVPLHSKRFRKRGYNQAELLADAISCYSGIPVCRKLVVRNKNTVPLKYQNPAERQNNLKKAFNIAQNDVKLKTIIVVDDIYTTGSTIDEVARTLKAAGVRNVYFLTLACGTGV